MPEPILATFVWIVIMNTDNETGKEIVVCANLLIYERKTLKINEMWCKNTAVILMFHQQNRVNKLFNTCKHTVYDANTL